MLWWRYGSMYGIACHDLPSRELLRFLETKKMKKKIEIAYYQKALPRKISELQKEIENLNEKIRKYKDTQWRMKDAVQTYLRATEKDRKFIEIMEKLQWVISRKIQPEDLPILEKLQKEFKEYFEKIEIDGTYFTLKRNKKGKLLYEGYVIVEKDSIPLDLSLIHI